MNLGISSTSKPAMTASPAFSLCSLIIFGTPSVSPDRHMHLSGRSQGRQGLTSRFPHDTQRVGQKAIARKPHFAVVQPLSSLKGT